MAYTFNPFSGNFDNTPSTIKGNTAYSNIQSNSSNWVHAYDTATIYKYNSACLPLSGGTITGNLNILSGLEIGSGSSTLYVDNQIVGINTETPNEELTVVGDVSATGQLYADGYNKSNWDSVYSNVNSNSANWDYQGTDIKELTGNYSSVYTTVNTNSSTYSTYEYVNSGFLPLSGGTITGNLNILSGLDVGSGTIALFISSNMVGINTENPNVDLTVNGSISSNEIIYDGSGNSGDWNSVYTTILNQSSSWISGEYLPLSGGTITGDTRITSNLTVYGDISATGDSYFSNTFYSTTSALSVVNIGNTGPALYVGNNGTGDIASFYDLDENVEILHVGGNNGSFPNVGIKTSTPNVDFTVNGQISSNGTIYSLNGNSNNWNSNYTTVQSNSSNWQNTFSKVNSTSSNWDSAYTTVNTNSATTWNYQGTDLKNLSSGWVGGNTAYTNLVSNSAGYLSSVDLSFLSVSGNWDSAYSTVNTNSAGWDAAFSSAGSDVSVRSLTSTWVGGNTAYTNLVSNSAGYLSSVDLSFLSVSGNWDSAYSTVNTNSATTWNYQGTDLKNLSSGWVGGNTAYTNLVSNSAGYLSSVDLSFLSVSGNWDSVYSNVNSNSANWDYQGTDLKNLSSGWVGGNTAYTNLVSNSAGYLSSVDLSFLSVSGNWDSVYSTVNTNSATTWNYQGTDLKNLSSGWVGGNTAYTNLVSNSAGYLSSVDLSFLSVSGNWDSAYSTVNTNSAGWDAAFSSAGSDVYVRSLTSTWVGGNTAYTNLVSNSAAYLSSVDLSFLGVSGNWDSVYSNVNSNSANWDYQGTDLKNLSSGWVGGNTAYTNLVSNSAGYLSSVDLSFLGVSGNWDSVYSNVNSNSANWDYQGTDLKNLSSGWVGGNTAYTNLVSNSAAYLSSVDLSFLSISGNWDSVYSNVNSNSANWGSLESGNLHLTTVTETKETPAISSGTLTLNLTSATLFYVSLNANITTLTLQNTPTSPKVYSFTLQFVGDGTSRVVTWPTSFRWPNSTPPTITSSINKVDTFTFLTHDGGTNWFAFTSNQNQ